MEFQEEEKMATYLALKLHKVATIEDTVIHIKAVHDKLPHNQRPSKQARNTKPTYESNDNDNYNPTPNTMPLKGTKRKFDEE